MDRTFQGLIAGTVAGIIMNTWNLLDFYLIHFTKIRFLDWAAVLVSWSKPNSIFTTVFYLVLQLCWGGFLGILFSHLLLIITPRGLIIKSAFYSLMCWYIFKITVNLFRVPFLSGSQDTPGFMSNVFAVILWGVSFGFVLKKLNKLYEI